MYADKTRRKPAFQVAQLPVKRMCFVSGYDVHLMALAEKILDHIEGNSQTSSAVIQKETGFSCQIQCGKSASQRSDDLLLFVGLQNIVQGADFIPLKNEFGIDRNKDDYGGRVQTAYFSGCIYTVYIVQFDVQI